MLKKAQIEKESSVEAEFPGGASGGDSISTGDKVSEEEVYSVVGNNTPSEMLVSQLAELAQEAIAELEEKVNAEGSFFSFFLPPDNDGRNESIGQLEKLKLVLQGQDGGADGPLNKKPVSFIKEKIKEHCNDKIKRKNTESIGFFLQKVEVLLSSFPEIDDVCGIDWVAFKEEDVEEWVMVEPRDGNSDTVVSGTTALLFQQQHYSGLQPPESNMANEPK
ncbi:hypothetical protein AVI51_09845 [Piscirickettsia salmonis]|uniref:Uncharacterized protein n=1 Tax=Piscirickettsia salmonis TaxID=1238 RepID=A0A9Q6LVU2_PISSA|nr:hypothetical protein [Piscirickettsia salmonis]ALA23635.1 uncharacterized protein KU39_01193 [Piscirickettsia salmonis]APS44076.1 hypothetical protein AVI48_06675 [Piscirickettsia salmonis]APS47437.1 hypothetical protein AVI49_07285 [Piscirickettsia salmonis]APS51127.1 hypothetical protein AVI50_09940 [Piscirickettsia salmonis]APS54336.1 hypothetical protein AVI51_09845 [Piscirickettsia salmonis]